MKYRPHHYALALYDALDGKELATHGAIIRRFAGIVRKNGDGKLLNTILARYEKVFLEKRGLKKVEVESASPLSEKTKSGIEKTVGESSRGGILLSEKVKPELLAGLTLLVNDTLLIDASGRTRISKLFAK